MLFRLGAVIGGLVATLAMVRDSSSVGSRFGSSNQARQIGSPSWAAASPRSVDRFWL